MGASRSLFLGFAVVALLIGCWVGGTILANIGVDFRIPWRH